MEVTFQVVVVQEMVTIHLTMAKYRRRMFSHSQATYNSSRITSHTGEIKGTNLKPHS
jgi:hypothetical protein